MLHIFLILYAHVYHIPIGAMVSYYMNLSQLALFLMLISVTVKSKPRYIHMQTTLPLFAQLNYIHPVMLIFITLSR